MKAELMKLPYNLRCDIARCSNKAVYSIGNPDSSKANHFHICEECLKGLTETFPEELKPERIVEKEVVKEIEKIVEVPVEKIVERVIEKKVPVPVETKKKGK